MDRVPDVPRGTVEIDGAGIDARIDIPPAGTVDAGGIALLADAVIESERGGVAAIRVRGAEGGHVAVIVSRERGAELVRLSGDGTDRIAHVRLAAGERVHVSVVVSGSWAGIEWLARQVSRGGMGAGGAEASADDGMPETAPPPPPPAAEIDLGGAEAAPDGAAAEEESPRTAAHVDAEMPARAAPGQEVAVRVRLSRDPLAPTPGASHDDAVIAIDAARPVTVTVMPRGLRFARRVRATRTLRLPDAGRSPAMAVFRLTALDTGMVEVSVIVRQEPIELPLATLRLTAEVAAAREPDAEPPARTARAAVAGRPAELAGLPTIRVDESIAGGRSTLRVAATIGGERAEHRADLGDKARFVDLLYRDLRGIREHLDGFRDDAERAKAAEGKLADVGGRLARRILGPDVRALLGRHRGELDGLIVQTSAEVDLPWEIVCIAPPGAASPALFLGDAGLVRFVYDTAHPQRITVSPDRVLTVSPAYVDQRLRLERTAEEVAELRARFTGITPAPEDRGQLSASIAAGFDLLHFAGHGRWRPDDPACQELVLASFSEPVAPDGSSYAETDARRDLPDRGIVEPETPGPFVFLSACDVGRLQSGAAGLGGFAEAFLRGGAAAFVGCGWAVRDDVASRFVTTLYRALLDDGLPLAQATRLARAACRDAGDLSAYAFAVFADPRARISTP
ncbi:DUF7363 domain-containing protein [Microbacterium cremeum]|uniref:DUF7363 domain-containing protein n=1 Tax=Microbacterium cremeum TaxID=2782169 RepID=UPI00188788E4|nr:CHAT domain-containing protein [Microbacterium cremeum]